MIINTTYLEEWRMIKGCKRQRTLYNNARENRNCILYDYQPGQFVFVTNKDIKGNLNSDKQGPFEIFSAHTNGTSTICCSPTVLKKN